MSGYIYLRDTKWYQHENVIKLGVTQNIINRGSVYITSEFIRGKYILVIEIPLEKLHDIDLKMKRHFKSYHVYMDGGTEFYKRDIIDLIIKFIQHSNIQYKVLSDNEMDLLERSCRIYTKIKSCIHSNVDKIKDKLKQLKEVKKPIEPFPHQQLILDKINDFYQKHSIGKLIWACGLGKTAMCMFIIHLMKYQSILIGVPSTYLQKQMIKKDKELKKMFPSYIIYTIGGDNSDSIPQIINKIHLKKPVFVISTYHSCYKLLDIPFDFKVGDEAHHLVGSEDTDFRLFHKIKSTHTLFMTATEKIANTSYSMDDDSIFGNEIDNKSVKWAIENKRITDYNILVLKNTLDDVDSIIHHYKIQVSNKDLFMSAYMCLKSIQQYNDLSHLLIYTNKIEDAKLTHSYVEQLLPVLDINDIYNKVLHSENCHDVESEITEFKKSKLGIISCVYIFGEGVDIPELNGVCIAGKMNSEIRIVQYLLRPNRLHYTKEKAYIIIPYIDTDNWEDENNSFEKVRVIISQMRNGDDSIEQKIKVSMLNKKYEVKEKDKSEFQHQYEFNDYELEKIKIRLRYSKSLLSKNTEEQEEYNYVRLLNQELNIDSIQKYNDCKQNHSHFIEDPVIYFGNKGVWHNWYHFMGIETQHYIQTKEEWIKFCKEINVSSLEDYYQKCEIYRQLPKEPKELYQIFTSVNNELELFIRRR
jgi:superfamily II DNA or RNA helicase